MFEGHSGCDDCLRHRDRSPLGLGDTSLRQRHYWQGDCWRRLAWLSWPYTQSSARPPQSSARPRLPAPLLPDLRHLQGVKSGCG